MIGPGDEKEDINDELDELLKSEHEFSKELNQKLDFNKNDSVQSENDRLMLQEKIDNQSKQLIKKQLSIIQSKDANPQETLSALISEFVEQNRWELFLKSKNPEEEWSSLFQNLQASLERICHMFSQQELQLDELRGTVQDQEQHYSRLIDENEGQKDIIQQLSNTNDN